MKKIILLVTLFCLQNLVAQNTKLGKVTVEELQETVCAIDSSAAAAYLFKVGATKFSYQDGIWLATTEVKTKIKIYKKEGLEYANQSVGYWIGGTGEKLYFDDAYTYNLIDGKVEKTKLKSESEFEEKINDKVKVKKITFPNVKEGSIIEFSYKLISPFIKKIDDFELQDEIPMLYVAYSFYNPEYFRYRTVITGFENVTSNEENITTGNFAEIKYTYSNTNVAAIKEESYVNNIRNYTSIIKYELASTNYPNRPVENFSLDWDGVAKSIYEDDNFGRELKFDNYFEEDLKPILDKYTVREERMVAVLEFVKNRMTWNEKNRVYCEDGVRRAYKQKTGNSAEINLMLTAMLNYAGIDTNPVLCSTKSNGVPMFPNQTAFNYVLAAVEVENEVILLDATDNNSFINILPTKTLNWRGRLIRKNGSNTEIDLMPKILSLDQVNIMATITEDGIVEGKIREQYFDYEAYMFREKNGKLTEDTYLEKLEKRHEGLEIGEYKLQNKKELHKPIIETYTFTHNNLVEKIGDKMFLSPLLFEALEENPFKQEVRKYPVDFTIPFKYVNNIIITIPEGYEVEHLPAPTNVGMEGNMGLFVFNTSANGKNIQIAATHYIATPIVGATQYETLKTYYKLMIEKQTEKIVLKKI